MVENERKMIEKKRKTFGRGFRMSRQILPSSSMFGWYTGLVNLTFGGSKGYLQCQKWTSFLKWVATLSAPHTKLLYKNTPLRDPNLQAKDPTLIR